MPERAREHAAERAMAAAGREIIANQTQDERVQELRKLAEHTKRPELFRVAARVVERMSPDEFTEYTAARLRGEKSADVRTLARRLR